MAKLVCGVGVTGGITATHVRNGVQRPTREYDKWHSMLRRCYKPVQKRDEMCYKGVSVCDDWLYYPNFYDWINSGKNMDRVIRGYVLDKDMRVIGNKVYSPDTCSLVPQSLNKFLNSSKAMRGKYPIGAYFEKRRNKLGVKINNPLTGKREQLGFYCDEKLALSVWKDRKTEILYGMRDSGVFEFVRSPDILFDNCLSIIRGAC